MSHSSALGFSMWRVYVQYRPLKAALSMIPANMDGDAVKFYMYNKPLLRDENRIFDNFLRPLDAL